MKAEQEEAEVRIRFVCPFCRKHVEATDKHVLHDPPACDEFMKPLPPDEFLRACRLKMQN
jgi:hypothetical protein